jgi:hypothetical protein
VTTRSARCGSPSSKADCSWRNTTNSRVGEEKQFAANTSDSPEALKGEAARFEEAGVDELIFFPTGATLDQVEGLAEAVL